MRHCLRPSTFANSADIVLPKLLFFIFRFDRVQRRKVNKMNFALKTGKNWAGMGWYGFGGRGLWIVSHFGLV